jgi:phosphopantothenoylcysteine decarboxylase / phosphopantothenate---cysteine ligase
MKVLISAGPMRTAIDSVRFVQNRSSGLMGLELAREAQNLGHEVEVLLGPVDPSIAAQYAPFRLERYEGPKEYGEKLEKMFADCDAFYSAAAVLDFDLVAHPGKLERELLAQMGELRVALQEVPDFVARMARLRRTQSPQRVIAFAAESGTQDEILKRAEKKMIKKDANALIANPVWPGLGPEAPRNEIWILKPEQAPLHFGPAPKAELAGPILKHTLI